MKTKNIELLFCERCKRWWEDNMVKPCCPQCRKSDRVKTHDGLSLKKWEALQT